MRTVLAQAAITKHHRQGGLNNRNLFLIVPEAGSLRSGYKHGWIPVRDFFLAYRQ